MTETDSRRWWALGGLTLAVLAVGLDGTVLSVALPTLARALHASESDLQWFSSGYLLVLAAAMLPLGLLGDRYGRKKIMLGSLALFGAGSAACAYSRTVGEFIAARVVLGIAGAGIIVMALSALTVLFSEEERPKAVGVWAAANFVALPIGPILGGWLLTNYWWGWVFLLNVPVALIGLTATAILVPDSRAAHPPGLDPIGIMLSVAGLVGVTYGLIEAGEYGWSNLGAWLLITGGLVVIVGFFIWERLLNRRPDGQPLLDLALFRSKAYLWGVVLAAVAILAMFGVLFTLPQYFQGVLGTTAMGSGVRLLPLIGGLLSRRAARKHDRQGPRDEADRRPRLRSDRGRAHPRHDDEPFLGDRIRRDVDGDLRIRPRYRDGDHVINCSGRNVGRPGRCRLSSAAGAEQGRRAARLRGLGQRARLGLRRPARPRCPAGGRGQQPSARACSAATRSPTRFGRAPSPSRCTWRSCTAWTRRSACRRGSRSRASSSRSSSCRV